MQGSATPPEKDWVVVNLGIEQETGHCEQTCGSHLWEVGSGEGSNNNYLKQYQMYFSKKMVIQRKVASEALQST